MSGDKNIICNNCGEEVPFAKYCPKCGSMLDVSPIDEVDDQLKRTKEIKKALTNFKNDTAKVLSSEINNIIDSLINNISNIEKKLGYQKDFLTEKDITKTICLYCGSDVKRTKFCSSCGKSLGTHIDDDYRSIVDYINSTQNTLTNLQRMIQAIISGEAYSKLVGLTNLLQQIKKRYQIKMQLVEKPTIKQVEHKPKVKPELEIAKERVDTFWSRIEKNLLNYIFFYLAIILFSIGVCLTIIYVVLPISFESTRIAIIYSLGVGIVIIGQVLVFISKAIDKRKSIKEEQLKKTRTDEPSTLSFLRQMAIAIMFIGSVVIFVGGILGMSYETIGVPTGFFLYFGYAVCILTIVIGVLNKSELIILSGIFEMIIFTSVDLLWGESQAVLNGVTSLIAFIVPIILVVLLAIFFKKWAGSIAVTSITTIMLCFPRISQSVGLEFLILILIPIMMVLVIQFGSQNIHVPYKQTMVVLSMVLPAITLIVLSFTNIFLASSALEPSWGRLYSYEIFLTGLAILAVAYYYPFIQQEHLSIDTRNKVMKILGQMIVGVVAIITVAIYRDYIRDTITTILFFLTYFAFGILSSISAIEKEASMESSIISFSISEILAIVLISIRRGVTTIADEALLFIISVTFLLLAYTTLIIPKAFIKAEALFLTWFILSGINIILVGNITAINSWLIFVLLIITTVGSLVVNFPVATSRTENWRILSIVTTITNAIILSIYAFTKTYNAFSYEALVIFLIFMLVSFLSFFDWKKQKEVTSIE